MAQNTTNLKQTFWVQTNPDGYLTTVSSENRSGQSGWIQVMVDKQHLAGFGKYFYTIRYDSSEDALEFPDNWPADEAEQDDSQLKSQISSTVNMVNNNKSTISSIQTSLAAASNAANNAQNTANQATDKANNAQNTANQATGKANAAQNTANNAQNIATNANNTANSNKSHLVVVDKNINNIQDLVNKNNDVYPRDDRVFGVAWNRGAGNTLNNGMTRIDDAKGMSSNLVNGHDDFDNAGPFEFKRVTDKFGNAFMRIPRMYMRKTKTGSMDNGQVTWEVSLVPFNGCYLPRCFVQYDPQGNPVGTLNYVDVGCYDAGLSGNQLISKGGVAPLVNTGIDSFRQYARNNGQGYNHDGYQLLDVHVWDILRTLFVIEFATLQSDSVFVGVRNGNSHNNTGDTDGLSGMSGQVSDHSFKYRGIENMYSNICQWCDGLNFDLQTGHQLYVCDDADFYASQVYTEPYEHVGYTWQWSDAKDEGLDPKHPEVNINDSTQAAPYQQHKYFCDWQGGWTGGTVAIVGNVWADADFGMFFVYADAPSAQWPDFGSRLVKKASV